MTNGESMKSNLAQYLASPTFSIRETLLRIDQNGQGIVFVVDDDHHLLTTISDGDVRRGMLKGVQLDDPLTVLIDTKQPSTDGPVRASLGTSDSDLLRTMNERGVRQIPILTADNRIVDVAFLSDLVGSFALPLRAVIMAGGYGTRLRPLTDNTPKPMLPVGDRPLLQRTIEQLKRVGISRFNVATHYKADIISGHFGDGQNFGVQIEYLQEDAPLGTAGALRELSGGDEPLLVMNGDILTQVNFRAMLEYHHANEAWLTVGVRQYEIQVPYGVVECEGSSVTRISEKPKMRFFVNAGIYILKPESRGYIPAERRFDMTDLIQGLLERGHPVVSFPIAEYWLDVGSPMDYEQAQRDVMDGRIPA